MLYNQSLNKHSTKKGKSQYVCIKSDIHSAKKRIKLGSSHRKYTVDEKKRLATVYCTHADRKSEERQKKLKDFIATCRAKKDLRLCVRVGRRRSFEKHQRAAGVQLSECGDQRREAPLQR